MATTAELTQAINNYQNTGSPNTINAETADVQTPDKRRYLLSDDEYVPSARDILLNPTRDYASDEYIGQAIDAGWGESRYDAMTGFNPREDIEEMRALAQPNAWKIGNGIIKGGVTAATTAANTVAGTIAGIGSAMFELGKQVNDSAWHGEKFDAGEILDAGVNNFLSEQLVSLQNLSEELFPNYRTQEERSEEYQQQWLRHIGTANFIGDSLIKNFGFTIGAMGGGLVWSNLIGKALSKSLVNDLMKGATAAASGDKAAYESLVNAAKSIPTRNAITVNVDEFAGNLRSAAKAINRSKAILQVSGATIGAIGEGNMEGLMARKEFMDEQLPKIRQKYQSQIDAVNSDILESGDQRFVSEMTIVDGYGIPHTEKYLTADGQQEAIRRKQELIERMNRAEENLESEADRLASWTFALNLPILTGSNLVQFGRMFSGGWKTARQAAKVSGKLGNYRGILENLTENQAAALLGTANALKVAGSEAFEEMAQGFISSGAQRAAEANLTEFNDDGYDDEATSRMRSWWSNWFEGGTEYLSDWKNWQEGFMGAVTGLLGMPGKGYFSGERGGVPGAIREARDDVRNSRAAAAKLNEITNDPQFREKWTNHIRHTKYDIGMEKALAEDNQYAWHDNNDKQMISDIIAFARAGKLDDLRDTVGSILSLAPENADEIRQVKEGTDPNKQVTTKNKSNEEIISDVKKPAQNILDVINEYSEVYDALQSISPVDAGDKMLEEMMFTALNLKAFEKRFMSMLDETRAAVEPIFKEKAKRDKTGKFVTAEKASEAFDRIKENFDLLMSRVLPMENEAEVDADTKKRLAQLKTYLADTGKEINSKLDDMIKVAEDRRKYYRKFNQLRNTTGAEYAEQALTPEKKQSQTTKEAIKQEAARYQSIDDVKASYRELVQNGGLGTEFFQQLAELAPTNKAVQDFLELQETHSDFLKFYEEHGLAVPDDMTIAKTTEKLILERMFDDAQSKQQYLDFDFHFDSQRPDGTILPGGRIKLAVGAVTGPTLAGMNGQDLIGRAYDTALTTIQNAMEEYKRRSDYVSGRRPQARQQRQGGTAAPTLAGMTGGKQQSRPTLSGMTGQPAAPQPVQHTGEVKKDSLGRDWQVGQKAYIYKLDSDNEVTPILLGEYTVQGFYTANKSNKMRLVDASGNKLLVDLDKSDIVRVQQEKQTDYELAPDPNEIIVNNQDSARGVAETVKTTEPDDLTEDEQQEINDDTENDKRTTKHYYRTGMPEVDSFKARDVRKILKNKALTLREKLIAIIKTGLRDFYLDNDGFRPTWQMLSNFQGTDESEAQNAFENVALVANVGDKVEFRIDPKFDIPGNDGKPQILVYTVKNGKSYLLSTLGYQEDYENLPGLQEAIHKQYDEWKKDNTGVFVFSDAEGKPIQSQIWSKRNGIVIYNENTKESGYAAEKRVQDIPGYDRNAPIVFINKTGDQVQLSGAAYDEKYLSRLADDEGNHGNLYYLARGKNGYCIPIRLNVEHFRRETMQFSSPVFSNIRAAIKEVANTASSILESNIEDIDAANKQLSTAVYTLGRYLDIHDFVLRIVQKQDGTFALRCYVNNNRNSSAWFNPNEVTEERLLNYFASQNLSVNIGETSNAGTLLDSDILTSNAQALWAKGTDIYYWRWTGEKFEPYQTQETLSQRKMDSTVESVPDEQKPTKEEIKEKTKEMKKTSAKSAAPSAPVQASTETLESLAQNLLKGKVGWSDMGSVVSAISNAIKQKYVDRLVNGLQRFNAGNYEDAYKGFTLMLGAVSTKAERTALRARIAEALELNSPDAVSAQTIYDYYFDSDGNDEIFQRIANVVAYSNYVTNVLPVLTSQEQAVQAESQTTPEQAPEQTDDILKEITSMDFSSITWNGLSDTLRGYMEQAGWDEESFNDLSPEGKESAIKCVGV